MRNLIITLIIDKSFYNFKKINQLYYYLEKIFIIILIWQNNFNVILNKKITNLINKINLYYMICLFESVLKIWRNSQI